MSSLAQSLKSSLTLNYTMDSTNELLSIGGFGGANLVELYDGRYCYVNEIKQGSLIKVSSNLTAIVTCVVKQIVRHKKMVDVGGVYLCIDQPFKIEEGPWVLPNILLAQKPHDANVLYNFVLNYKHYIKIGKGSITGMTLGYKSNEKTYFKTDIVDIIKKMPGWGAGEVWVN
jgi:hypothetical protein